MMADGTKIEWTDATWNVVTGCSVTSPGCKHCYAMKLAGMRLKHHPSRAGLTIMTAAGPVWTGEVRFNEQWLDQPLQWTKPRMIFVCAHGDLFHEDVPDEWIDRVFEVMGRAHWHTFQVLTKRSARMREYMNRRVERGFASYSHVWLGVSAEDQERADQRIADLLATEAGVRWVSFEPLLGPINASRFMWPVCGWWRGPYSSYREAKAAGAECGLKRQGLVSAHARFIDWAVTGGESGPGARPSNPQWFRDLRDQCAAAGVPLLHKQNGAWASVSEVAGSGEHHIFEDGRTVRHVGKALAGRLLDGRTHDEFPEVR